ncbi:MAG: hypothetical protein M3313_01965 [Actinomycetota bacterium]|nr:hypothetical protein [Actinomycetota bacterium]
MPASAAPKTPVGSAAQPPVRVLVFSQRAHVREAVRAAIGRRPARDLGRIDWIECETIESVLSYVDAGAVDLVLLDGESQPTGGMGIARQLKYEVPNCPPVCVLIARQADRWLAHWSLADATLSFPLDPLRAADTVAGLLRDRLSGVPVVNS